MTQWELCGLVLSAALLMAITVCSWVGLGTVLIGRDQPANLGVMALFGLLLVTTIGMALNFFIPIDGYVSLAAMASGLILFFRSRRRIIASLGKHSIFTWIGLGLPLLTLAVFAIAMPPFSDTGLYHLQAVQWIEKAPRIFGLAHLHDRLGFNNVLFTATAMADIPGVGRKNLFLFNNTLVFVAFAAMILPRPGSDRDLSAHRASHAFAAVAVVLYFKLWPQFMMPSPSYDTPPALMSVLACWSFLRLFEAEAKGDAGERHIALLLLLVSLAFAIAVKLSAAPFILLALGAFFYVLWRRRTEAIALLKERAVLILALFSLLWLADGLSSTGCLLYPFPASCVIKAAWALPLDAVQRMAICIKVWARIPGPHAMEALHGWAWLKSWPPPGILSWSTRGFRIAGFFLLLLLAAVVMDRLAGLKPLRRSALVEGALCYGLGTVLVATLFWFLTAPDFRFAIGILATLPALVVVWPAWRLASGIGLTRFFLDGRVMLAIMLFLALASLKGNWRVAALSASTWTHLPRPAVTAIALGPHFSAVIPSDPGDPSCWDTPIPCVPGKPAASLGWGRILIWRAIEILPPPRP